jgi:hypothetical protein
LKDRAVYIVQNTINNRKRTPMPEVGTTKQEKMIRAETSSAPTALITYTGSIEALKNKRIQVVFVGADLVSARN